MHLLNIPPGGQARAHKHLTTDITIYMLEDVTIAHWRQTLEHKKETIVRDIPADMPRLPFNPGLATALISRTDPRAQQSVILLPELEALVPGPHHLIPRHICDVTTASHPRRRTGAASTLPNRVTKQGARQ